MKVRTQSTIQACHFCESFQKIFLLHICLFHSCVTNMAKIKNNLINMQNQKIAQSKGYFGVVIMTPSSYMSHN
jgi:hypothetical protein